MSEGRNNVVAITAAPSYRDGRVVRRAELQMMLGIGRTKAFELIADGMPVAGKDHRGRNLFRVADVQRWLNVRGVPATPKEAS